MPHVLLLPVSVEETYPGSGLIGVAQPVCAVHKVCHPDLCQACQAGIDAFSHGDLDGMSVHVLRDCAAGRSWIAHYLHIPGSDQAAAV